MGCVWAPGLIGYGHATLAVNPRMPFARCYVPMGMAPCRPEVASIIQCHDRPLTPSRCGCDWAPLFRSRRRASIAGQCSQHLGPVVGVDPSQSLEYRNLAQTAFRVRPRATGAAVLRTLGCTRERQQRGELLIQTGRKLSFPNVSFMDTPSVAFGREAAVGRIFSGGWSSARTVTGLNSSVSLKTQLKADSQAIQTAPIALDLCKGLWA